MRTGHEADERLLVRPGDDSRRLSGTVLPIDAGRSHRGPGVLEASP
jgi:hypothetical protein